MEKWKELVAKNSRYSSIVLLETPVKFAEEFAGYDIPCVQLHSVQVCGTGTMRDIVGFCGAFEWKNGKVIPLDGDSYTKNMNVFGYEWFQNKSGDDCLDILVGEDW